MITVDDLLQTLRDRLPETLIATDFDGTLAPLVRDPMTSRPVAGAIDALIALTRAGATVAVVTGRSAETAIQLGGLDAIPGVTIDGMYGIESWHDGELTSPEAPESMVTLRERLPGLLEEHDTDPDVWIEDKGLSLVVHGRRAANPEAALAPLLDPARALAGELGIELHLGHDVLEFRIPGYEKSDSIERLSVGHKAVLYLGDDLGDLPAFHLMPELRERGIEAWGVGVLQTGEPSVARAADVTVDTPEDIVALLNKLL